MVDVWPFGLEGPWLRYATLQNLIPCFLGLRPHALNPVAIQGKEGIKFCHLATLLRFLAATAVCAASVGGQMRGRARATRGISKTAMFVSAQGVAIYSEFKYRVTILVDSNLPLTPKQKLHFSS